MSKAVKDDRQPGWCLVGVGADRQQTFHLLRGDNTVGSLSRNTIVLDASEISREHAVLRIGDGRVVVEDLQSKNGTFVNGSKISRAELSQGDELGFGPLRLVLQRAEPADGELAVELDPDAFGDLLIDTDATASVETQSESSWCCRGEVLLEQVLGPLLSQPQAAFSQALTPILEELQAGGGCLLEWDGLGEPVVLAIAGTTTDHLVGPQVRECFHQATAGNTDRKGCTALRRVDHGLSCVVLAYAGSIPVGLVLAADLEHLPGIVAALANILRIVAFRRGAAAERGRPAHAHGPTLVIPDGFIVGRSAAMQALLRQMESMVSSSSPVVLVGETGVGKEHLARIVHDSSPAASGPFIPVNCVAIPSDLLEAEMFGIDSGVATGVSARRGRFQLADGGSLFLDEIGDMPPKLQAKLLRVLEDGQVTQLGGKVVPVRTRVIAATNRDLLERVRQGSFRRDLYYRIAVLRLDVPALRERPEDIPALVEHFLWRFTQELRKPLRGVTLAAMTLLQRYSWPGNIRELRNEIGRLVHTCPAGQVIGSGMIARHISAGAADDDDAAALPASLGLKPALAQLEERLVREALSQTGGNRTRAAELLGISRNNLLHKIKGMSLPAEENAE